MTGCGTSEHAALAGVEILREAAQAAGLRSDLITSEQAFELSLAPPAGGLVIGISHEGATRATNAALSAAREAGADTAVVTVSGRSPAAALAGIVIETGELDQGWCHTVGYLSPILAAAAVGAHLAERRLEPATFAGLVAAGTRDESGAERIAAALAEVGHLLVIASGSDRPAGRELVLKVEEASWLPSAYRDLETFLHGHLPASGGDTGLVLVLVDRDRRGERLGRAVQALAAARVVGIRAAAIVARDVGAAIDPALTPAGRLLVGRGATATTGRGPGRHGHAAPAADRTTGPGAGHEPGPHPARRSRLPGGVRGRGRSVALDLADQDLAHDVDHVEVPRQEVLEHDPLDAGRLEAADHGLRGDRASR